MMKSKEKVSVRLGNFKANWITPQKRNESPEAVRSVICVGHRSGGVTLDWRSSCVTKRMLTTLRSAPESHVALRACLALIRTCVLGERGVVEHPVGVSATDTLLVAPACSEVSKLGEPGATLPSCESLKDRCLQRGLRRETS